MAARVPIVLDSTVLINLAKSGLIDRLRALPEPLLVPPEVVRETTGTEGFSPPEAKGITRALSDHLFRIAKAPGPSRKRMERHGLGATDAAVLALALARGAVVASDDSKVRKIAVLEGVPRGGSGYLLGRLVKEGALTKTEALEALDRMVAGGWWVSVATYAQLRKELG
jgi:predicted nucleic acid-binding protein